tara:strand:+ start:1839 stop:2246 length:408 start_codon:yes stop_codon:yes gene_type:complete
MARKFPVQSYEWVPGDPETGRLGTMRPRYVETHWRKGEVTPGPESVVTRGLTEGMDAAGLDPEQTKAIKKFEAAGEKQFADMMRAKRAEREETDTTLADKRLKRQQERVKRKGVDLEKIDTDLTTGSLHGNDEEY